MSRYKAKLDGYNLKLKDISDSIPNNIAHYSYPFQDGESMDYMGEDAHIVRFETSFRRETYKEHYDFVKHIRKGLIYTLLHPIYGTLKGRISNPSIIHKEYKKWVDVQFTFLEQLIDVEITFDNNIVSINETAYIEGQKQNMQSFEDVGNTSMGSDAKEVMSKNINPLKSVVEQAINVSFFTRQKLADLDRMLGVIDYWEHQITTPLDAIINTIDFGTKLPGRIIGSCSRVVERVATAKRKVNQAPSTFIASLKINLNSLKRELKRVSKDDDTYNIVAQSIDISTAHSVGVNTAYIYEEDEKKRAVYESTIDLVAFDYEGNKVLEFEDIDLLNQNELENSLYLARELLGVTLQYNREFLKANKEMAHALDIHVSKIKLQRDLIIDVDLSNNIVPIHVLTNSYDLPHRYINKIMAINNIENPTFATGKVKLYARS